VRGTQIGDFAFGSWLEMAAKKGRQDPKQLMPAISGIVDDMNNMRAGKTFRSRAASDFVKSHPPLLTPPFSHFPPYPQLFSYLGFAA
jgi:hypothetical protein